MRFFLLVSMSSALVSACAPTELIELGGDAGHVTESVATPTGADAGADASIDTPDLDASAALDLPPTARPTAPAEDAATFSCAMTDASRPILDPMDGSDGVSIPLSSAGSPASAADGWIVFDSDVASPGPGVYAIHPDGSGLRRLISGSDSEPVVSPDGTTLAYSQVVGGVSQVFATKLAVGSTTQLTSMSADADQPAFSPDGKLIAFRSGTVVYLMNADGSDARPVLVSPVVLWSASYFGHPTFGRDENTLIVDRDNEIDAFDLSGGSPRFIVNNATFEEDYPALSRDGTSLAFILGPCEWGLGPTVDVMPADEFVFNPCNACPVSGTDLGTLTHPSWGPGSLLTFSHTSSAGTKRIVVMDSANPSAEPVEILQDSANQDNPVWAPSTFVLP
jgi:Tol biopolymer transport system component